MATVQPPLAPQGRRTTLADVAHMAGVSVGTVSKALNGRPDISEATRRVVMDAAAKLSFRPNSLAQSLLSGRTNTVGLLTNDLEGRFSLPILTGAEDAFGAEQLSVLLCDARGDVLRERHHINLLLGRQVDGLLVVSDKANPREPLPGRIPVPVVYAYGPSTDPNDISVVTDDFEGGRRAASHLLEVGHRKIAYLGGDRSYIAARLRADGAQAALAQAGYSLAMEPIFGAWSEAWGRQSARIALERRPDLDALLCGNDQIARGALDTLRALGRPVPSDVAVMGYDNWLLLAENSDPPLSTLDMNFKELGRTAARLLFDALEGHDRRGSHVVEPTVVVRGTSAQ